MENQEQKEDKPSWMSRMYVKSVLKKITRQIKHDKMKADQKRNEKYKATLKQKAIKSLLELNEEILEITHEGKEINEEILQKYNIDDLLTLLEKCVEQAQEKV